MLQSLVVFWLENWLVWPEQVCFWEAVDGQTGVVTIPALTTGLHTGGATGTKERPTLYFLMVALQ